MNWLGILFVTGMPALAGTLFCAIVFDARRSARQRSQSHAPVCPDDQCGCANPANARFCRRCGRPLAAVANGAKARAA